MAGVSKLERELENACDWLFARAGPVIRYRVAREVLGEPDDSPLVRGVREQIARSDTARYWLAQIAEDGSLPMIHHGGISAENTLGVLTALGMDEQEEQVGRAANWLLHVGVWPAFDAFAQAHEAPGPAKAPTEERAPSARMFWTWFNAAVALGFVARSRRGSPDAVVRKLVEVFLEELSRFALSVERLDVHVPQADNSPRPSAYARYQVLRNEVFQGGMCLLPTLYHLNAFAASPWIAGDERLREHLGAILDYVFSNEYQALPDALGVCRLDRRRMYVHGWKIALVPQYFEDKGQSLSYRLRLLELLAGVRALDRYEWCRQELRKLEEQRTREGVWNFGSAWLRRSKGSYWITGAYPNLEDGRGKDVPAVEATFRMVKLKTG